MDINVDLKATQGYYESAADENLCDCDYCRNYCRQVRAAYPEVAEYLAGLGIDIEKPLETSPLEPDEDGYLEYCICQYVAFGTCSAEYYHKLGNVEFGLSTSHPNTGIDGQHFIIDVYPIGLRYAPRPCRSRSWLIDGRPRQALVRRGLPVLAPPGGAFAPLAFYEVTCTCCRKST